MAMSIPNTKPPNPGESGDLPTNVLVYSHDKGTLLTLSDILRRSGETTMTAQTPEHAWACIKTGQVGVVILDMTKPSMEGLLLLRTLRTSQNAADVPILFIISPGYQPPVLPPYGEERVRDGWLTLSSPEETLSNMVSRLLQQLALCRTRQRTSPGSAANMPTTAIPNKNTQRLAAPPDTVPGVKHGVMAGRLDAVDVTKILGMIEPLGLSGTLLVEDEQRKGEIYFVSGAVWHAKLSDIEGPDSLFLLFHMKKGAFRFDLTPPTQTRTIRGNTMSLLLEGLRQMDEAKAIIRDHHAQKKVKGEAPPGTPAD